MRIVIFALLFVTLSAGVFAQTTDETPIYEYDEPTEFEIGGIKVTGAEYSDDNAVIGVSGLKVGDKIRVPGPDIPQAIKKLWKLRLFTDVQILKEKTIGDVIFLEILVVERPRLSKHSFKGVKKSKHDDLNDEVNKFVLKGGIVTENVKANAAEAIEKYFIGKGFLDAAVTVDEFKDTSRINAVGLTFNVDRGPRVKIADIIFEGNENMSPRKLRKQMKETKWKKRIFSSSKFIKHDYQADKNSIIAHYNTIGYRDARILSDSMWRNDKGQLVLKLNIEEGNRYHFRNIAWKGNSIHDSEKLDQILGINSGDIYNQELLNNRLSFSQDGRDVSTLYMDDGYLFFQVDPVEVAIEGDSIDLEIRIFEGPQATIDKVVIKGNDRTHEHVIRRELRTLPGQKFSRTDIIRSQRQIMNLGYFNPETLGINTPVNPQRGTVDIEYSLEERPSDQLELSAGWGGYQGVIGTLGVSFNNFALRNMFKKNAWRPVPMGDGQRLSLRAQSNGRFYQSYNISFTEPWLGGKKPNSLTVGGYYNKITRGTKGLSTYGSFEILNGSVSLGTRLSWPDDNFVSSTAINIQTIKLNNYFGGFTTDEGEYVSEGNFNNFSITQTLARTTVNDPIFPREGSTFSVSLQFTPPYSLFSDKNYADLPATERFKWLEYHKWRINADWYAPLGEKFVIKASMKFGFLGKYNSVLGTSPFERFQIGGDGINNQQFSFTGVDIISLRGYEITDLENNQLNGQSAATPLFDKFTVELRYPISLNPSSTIYVLAFAQGGNSWRSIRDFNPFDIKRSAGVGLRVFLPMFGLLGFDYGFGFDKDLETAVDGSKFKAAGKFSIILGFEPE
ncbi:MAG: outer membrane protein assembly factor BamA [Saprospiraceae bacterium]|nr:outer membrane protein assembly factor BamA [Saprospiraceae bacterium]MCB9324750.1 outer membrane protein assembly factor BamA [Lewinellaceae bacterium]